MDPNNDENLANNNTEPPAVGTGSQFRVLPYVPPRPLRFDENHIEMLTRNQPAHVISTEQRTVVFLGPGKTSLVRCIGNVWTPLRIQELEVDGIDLKRCMRRMERPDGSIYFCDFNCYDTKDFTGNPEKDIFIVHSLFNLIHSRRLQIHAIYFCFRLKDLRLTEVELDMLRLIVDYCDPELRTHLRFIVTDTADALVSEELQRDIENQIRGILSAGPARPLDVTLVDLIDPARFLPTNHMFPPATEYWTTTQVFYHDALCNIPDNRAFRINKLTTFQKYWSIASVYRVKIAAGVFGVAAATFALIVVYKDQQHCKAIIQVVRENNALREINEALKAKNMAPVSPAVGGNDAAGNLLAAGVIAGAAGLAAASIVSSVVGLPILLTLPLAFVWGSG